jgi:hypothetical protein
MAKTNFVLPPDIGATLAGQAPAASGPPTNITGPCGRGIRCYGDARGIGDLTAFKSGSTPQDILTDSDGMTTSPGTVAAGLTSPEFDNTSAPGMQNDHGFDSVSASQGAGGSFGGGDASDEGKNNLSGHRGNR